MDEQKVYERLCVLFIQSNNIADQLGDKREFEKKCISTTIGQILDKIDDLKDKLNFIETEVNKLK